jgi:hypothetical protein
LIYIIGSGFSGLATAFILSKKYKNITVISPSRKEKTKKSATLFKYLLSLSGEIKFNSKKVSKKINLIEKTKLKNCKFISSYQEGGLSNIWGGVLSNIYQYNLKNFPFNQDNIKKIKKNFLNLEKIIFKKNFRYQKKNSSLNKNITILNFNKKNDNVENLKKYLLNRNIKFKYDLYLKKIEYKSKKIVLHNLNDNKNIKLDYKKLYISAGPINTAKIILNSFKEFKKIKIYETRHFFCLVKKKINLNNIKYFKFEHDGLKFYSQLYSFRNILSIFLNFKKFNIFKNLFIGQCYLNTQDSSYIEIKKDSKSKFLITGKQNKSFKKKINKIFRLYNKKNFDLKFYFPLFNSIGASNHLGGSFPMSKKKGKFKTKLNGELYYHKDIYLSDSSVLNEIDMQPITTFSLMNILRMNSY